MGTCVSNQDDVRNANQIALSLEIKHFTWSRDSHGLFDYENKNVIKGQLKTNSSKMIFIRQKEAIRVIQTKDELLQYQNQSDVQELIRINRQITKYFIESIYQQQISEETEGLSDCSPWVVVKSLKNQKNDQSGYSLKQNDYIKLGRVRFRIREISCQNNNTNNQEVSIEPELQKFVSDKSLNIMNIHTQEDEQIQGEEPQCRICYNDAQTDQNNPLIDCCKCQGSVKFIHLICLQTWLLNKLQPKTTKFSVSFQWKQFECEVCKAPIPNRVKYQNRIYETIVLPKPDPPYLTLEILSRDRNQSKGTHIISFSQKQFIKLGRGHDSDVRITDISVSRLHAIIKYSNSQFIIEDQQSKFGTLVLMKNPTQVSVDLNKNLAIQIGRSVLNFQVSKDWNVQTCCMGSVSDEQMQQQEDNNNLIGSAIGDDDQVQVEQAFIDNNGEFD
ncbi:unnamed protein product [Paramecium primaurelia]|uniref:Zinc finger protein n=1 Tax=Paramecium primaurelia TaxID=5886 RepID=A0A8S1L8I3_PARPR|nr:unnamed protein product [Paramecium primaurelia]